MKEDDILDKIDCFDGKYAFLSNFYPSPVVIAGVKYPTSEHAFQAAKTWDPHLKVAISNLPTPGLAKRAGRKLVLRPHWDDIKISTMRAIVKEKFKSNPDLADLLLDTGETELIEGNTWHDTFWGVCNGIGENNLGKILMDIRKEIRTNRIEKTDTAKRIIIIQHGGELLCVAAAEELEVLVVDRMTDFAPKKSIMDIEGESSACRLTTAVNDPAWLVELWGDYVQGVKENE